MKSALYPTLCLLITAQVACALPLRDECSSDADCGGECVRTGECVAPGTAVAYRINWTIDGQPASDEACLAIAELSVTLQDSRQGDEVIYRPVTCSIGTFFFDRMPPRLDRVQVIAHGDGRLQLDRQTASLVAGGEVTVDLRL
ncbi:MAG: hypothetical protein AAGC55_16200 [Myxococcota bacterium]